MKSPDKNYIDKLLQILKRRDDIIRFVWNCTDNMSSCLLGNEFLPDHTGNPYEYIMGQGVIDPDYISAYEVYCSQIEMGTAQSTSRDEIVLELKMNIFGRDFEFVSLTSMFLKNNNGVITDVVGNIARMTDEKVRSREILECFTMDRNPAIIQKRIRDLVENVCRDETETDKHIAFIQFDVERFKLINDIYGAETGDKVLAYINEVLNILCGNEKPHGRLSSDLFMVVMPFEDKNEIIDFIRLIESRILGFMGIEMRLCFGVYVMRPEARNNLRRCGDNAGLARSKVKGNAISNIGFYDDDLLLNLHKRQEIEDDMQNALVSNEFLMYLQPKVCISSGRLISAEALARWNHHKKGMISPGDFIPVFEKDGFIIKLDRFIWEEACKQIRLWMDAGLKPVPISVNVSRSYLGTGDIVEELYALVKKYDIPIEYLQLEITESTEGSGIDAIVERFKQKGFTMLMDDFGSGYSSLNMLKTTRFDVLKIDREFFSEFMESTRGRKIIEHTISMSKDIGLDIIAEGVETFDQARFLNQCGCDAAQGFLYSKPLDKEKFNALMKNGKFDIDLFK